MPVNIEPATTRLADVVRAVQDAQLGAPTPCPGITVGDLIDHVSSFAHAFTAAGRRDFGTVTGPPPKPDARNLGADWRERIPDELASLADAWRDPDAWSGMTKAGGQDLPGEVAGLVALDECVVHGWDIARATGQPYEVEPQLVDAVREFAATFAAPGMEQAREGLFGPVVPVADDAPDFDRVLGLTGRSPDWTPG